MYSAVSGSVDKTTFQAGVTNVMMDEPLDLLFAYTSGKTHANPLKHLQLPCRLQSSQ